MIRCNRYPEGKVKAVVLSYDDGRITDRIMADVINEYGLKATFHLNAGNLGKEGFVGKDEIRRLYAGHEIAAHSFSHPHLTELPGEEQVQELWKDRAHLEVISGGITDGFSYPYGEYDERLLQVVKTLGFSYARTIQSQYDFRLPNDFFVWHPACHHREGCVELAQRYLDYDYREGISVFLLWGHSHNFEREGNWNILERFCRLMGRREEIWYCTEGDFVRYIRALRALKTTVQGDCIHNPSAQDVWLEMDGSTVCIGAGKTIRREEKL